MTKRKLMLTSPGSYENPSDKPCWSYCSSCGRCENRFNNYTNAKCRGCSGRFDPRGMRHPHDMDTCDCKNGNLRWVTQEGQIVQTKFLSNPFAGVVKYEGKTDDEVDWDDYLKDAREKLDDPNWDPIQFTDDSSTKRFFDDMRKGNQK